MKQKMDTSKDKYKGRCDKGGVGNSKAISTPSKMSCQVCQETGHVRSQCRIVNSPRVVTLAMTQMRTTLKNALLKSEIMLA